MSHDALEIILRCILFHAPETIIIINVENSLIFLWKPKVWDQ